MVSGAWRRVWREGSAWGEEGELSVDEVDLVVASEAGPELPGE